MKIYKVILTTVLVGAAPFTYADGGMSAFGFVMGKPLDLPACKYSEFLKYDGAQEKTCIEPEDKNSPSYRSIHFSPEDRPALLSTSGVTGTLIDGILEGLNFGTLGYSSKDQTLATLVEKYGKPTRITDRKLQNRYGAKFDTYIAEWDNPDLYVEFTPTFYDSLKEGFLSIETPKGRQHRLDQIKNLPPVGKAL